jgi:tight adherence protein C
MLAPSRLSSLRLHARSWLRLLAAVSLAWLTSLPFTQPDAWRLLLVVLGSGLFCFAFQRWSSQRQARDNMEQYQALLAYLSSRLAAGETLERALVSAGPVLGQQLGIRRPICQGLNHLAQQIEAHVDLDQTIRNLLTWVDCPAVRPFMLVLPQLRQMGGQLDRFIKSSHRMLAEQISLAQDIASEQAQKNAEALILMVLPFFLALILGNSADGYAQSAQVQAGGRIGMALAYILACLAAVWTIVLISGQPVRSTSSPSLIHKSWIHESRQPRIFKTPTPSVNLLSHYLTGLLLRLYRGPLTGHWGKMLLLRIAEQNHSQENPARRYMAKKMRYLLAGLLLGAIWSITGLLPMILFWVPGLAIAILQDIQVWRSHDTRKNLYRLAYPAFLNWIVILLQAGFSLDKTLAVAAQAWLPEKNIPDPKVSDQQVSDQQVIANDLSFLCQQQQAGRSCAWILDRLAEQNPLLEIQSAIHMMIRYDKEGGQELLDLLNLQATGSWNLLRNGIRKSLETRSLQLLFPMMIDLVVVLLIAILPAMLMLTA